jgi:aspartyl-tRNA(Asn)/glutamyl-tRNA(Gln) amidotransferase subunit A
MSDNTRWLPITELAEKVCNGDLKAVELVEQALQNIEEKKEYDAIISVTAERARARAASIDAAVAKGEETGLLAGVPFIAKDNILTFGADATAGSHMLQGFRPPYQATVIERLEAQGAICVAKANMDAFGHGGSTENSDYMVTKHPADKSRVPGGSSGGSAAAVMLDMVPFALGTDTGGSTRQPASLTGAVGLKPSYGLTSRYGVVAMASSTDTIGTLTRSVDDLAAVFDVFAGQDPRDSTTISRDPAGYADLSDISGDVKGKKFGLITEWMGDGVEEGVKNAIREAADKFRAAGADVVEISLPSLPLSLAVYYVLIPAEISSNLSRNDGQRYQHATTDAAYLEESYTKARSEGFGPEAKRRIMIGTHVLSSGYYDAYYAKAQTVRTKLINDFNDAFSKVDFLIGPVSPETAFPIGQASADPLKAYLLDIMTVAPSLVGIPAISVPAGTDEKNLPVGLQIMAPQRQDRALLGVALATEKVLA